MCECRIAPRKNKNKYCMTLSLQRKLLTAHRVFFANAPTPNTLFSKVSCKALIKGLRPTPAAPSNIAGVCSTRWLFSDDDLWTQNRIRSVPSKKCIQHACACERNNVLRCFSHVKLVYHPQESNACFLGSPNSTHGRRCTVLRPLLPKCNCLG